MLRGTMLISNSVSSIFAHALHWGILWQSSIIWGRAAKIYRVAVPEIQIPASSTVSEPNPQYCQRSPERGSRGMQAKQSLSRGSEHDSVLDMQDDP
jgi:hypothetical protein